MSRSSRNRRRRPQFEMLETRRLMVAGLPLGATPTDTAEFMLGTVTLTPIFLDSNGAIDPQTQSWSEAEIDAVLANITAGADWWSDALDELGTVHTLEFTVDDTYARNPVPTGYEPIDRISNFYDKYVGDFLDYVGVDSSLQIDDGMFVFNNAQREKFQTDWAFSIFIADSSDDSDGFFESGGSFRGAFAFAGGLYIVSPSTRPISTFAHELGHMFWAFDEYSGGGNYADSRGYYNTPNLNAWDNPTPGFEQETSIMAGYDSLVAAYGSKQSAASTFALVGWQDSDGNGIFDVLDVPLNLEASGALNPTTGQFDFSGTASAGTLPNRNPAGTQSDITINRISRLEVSIDGGEWTSIASPDSATAAFDLSVPVPTDFTTIAFRIIDAKTGVTSETWTGTPTTPLLAHDRPLAGLAYLDTDANLIREADEQLLSDLKIQITAADGSPLPRGTYAAADIPVQQPLSPSDGITLTGNVNPFNAEIEVRPLPEFDGKKLFSIYDPQLQIWSSRLGSRVKVTASLDQPTSYVEVDVLGMQATGGAFARVEAYDAAGNLVDRATTDMRNAATGKLDFGQSQTLRLRDPGSSIASIRIFGHAGTSIGLAAIRTGIPALITTDAHGAFSVEDLPAGQYTFTPIANQVIHQFAPLTSSPTAGSTLEFAGSVVDSPRYNAELPYDVNGDGKVTAIDALQVINDLNRFGSRTLTWAETTGSFIDVSNDGVITSLDALRVINYLNAQDAAPASSEPLPQPSHDRSTAPPPQATDTDFASAAGDSVASNRSGPRSTPTTVVAGIDQVFREPIKWVSQVSNELDQESPGLVFDDTSAAQQ